MLWIGAISSGLTTSTASQDPPLTESLDLGQGAKNTMLLRSRCVVIMVQISRSVFHKYFRAEMLPFAEVSREFYLKGRWGCCFDCYVEQAVLSRRPSESRILCMGWKMTCISIFIHGQDSPL